METVTDFTFLGSKITADDDFSHEIKRRLLRLSKAMTNLVKVKSVKVLVIQLCLTLCDPMDYSPDSSINGMLQARILERVTNPFSRGFSQLRDQT